MKQLLFGMTYLIAVNSLMGQMSYSISGKVIDAATKKPLPGVLLEIQNGLTDVYSIKDGTFLISSTFIYSAAEKTLILVCTLDGYEKFLMEILMDKNNRKLQLNDIRLHSERSVNSHYEGIEMDSQEMSFDKGGSNNITGILSASKSVFAKTAAYDFGATFFKPRYLGSEHGTVMINGVRMNKILHGRPEWSNWGGLNDALRNQEYYPSFKSSSYELGGLAASVNMISLASRQRKGLKISYAVSNKSYNHRLMSTYNTGIRKNGWAYTFSASMRWADEGFKSGTYYRAYSFLASIDKNWGERNVLNATVIYALNDRGKSAPMTQEVYDLKNNRYNAYWGFQQGIKRNSRAKYLVEPLIQLNHYFKINASTAIHNHLSYQFGTFGASRLDYGGGRLLPDSGTLIGGGANPDPTYYQKLPSYFLKDQDNPDYAKAYLAQQEFKDHGQIKWMDLYEENRTLKENSIYALYEDRNDDKVLSFNSGMNKRFDQSFMMDFSLSLSFFESENYALMKDLLGGSGYLDVDTYADNWLEAQNYLAQPDRIIVENQKFRYHYLLNSTRWNLMSRMSHVSRNFETSLTGSLGGINYQRTGKYENGSYKGKRSLGASENTNFQHISIKADATYKLSGRHIFSFDLAYLETPPSLKNVFSNVRESNDVVIGLTKEKSMAFDFNYLLRYPNINVTMSFYVIRLMDRTQVSFYYADGLMGLENASTNAFVQEVLTGLDQSNKGLELSFEIPLFISFKLKGVAAIGESIYSNNPNLYLTSDDFNTPLNLGKTNIKNYKVSNGPQQAYSLGFEYSSPTYWWLGLSYNYFRQSFISIAPIMRTKNFLLDSDGLPIYDYDPELVEVLLEQESLGSYSLVNLVGGKSWKIEKKYLGIFVSVNNITNKIYRTGGFEQSRNANYRTLLEDKSREAPLFAPKYWFGYGTTFYASLYLRL